MLAQQHQHDVRLDKVVHPPSSVSSLFDRCGKISSPVTINLFDGSIHFFVVVNLIDRRKCAHPHYN